MILKPDYYGDEIRWFVGTIVNDNDPENRGRVQVRIFGVHAPDDLNIPNQSLPWAESMLPTTEGGVSGVGRIPQMLASARVFGVFLDGKTSQTPLVLGCLTHNEGPSIVQQVNNAEGSNPTGTPEGVSLFSPTNVGVNGTVISGDLHRAYDGGNATRDARRLIIMRYFRENNVPLVTAAGIVGNLEVESGLEPTIVSSVPGESSQGLAQWNPAAGRLQQLQRFSEARGTDWREFFSQLEFILHELRGSPITSNDGGGTQARVYRIMNNCTKFDGGLPGSLARSDAWDNSTYQFMHIYERPHRSYYSSIVERERYARQGYEQYQTLVERG